LAASAGGLKALTEILSEIPANFSASVLIVLHLDPNHPSLLAHILSRTTPLRVKEAEEGDLIEPGRAIVAVPNKHLVANTNHTISLTRTELVHFVRPSADILFESLASIFGRQVVGVVLTGTGSDGANGVKAIKEHGGIVVVEEPTTAEFKGMPSAAMRTGAADYILPLEKIAAKLLEIESEGIAP
jgi:two-component system chemotaxis response regulator CheB